MKNGRQIPWNVTPICETSQISCLMGRLHTKDVLENHKRTNHSVWFIGWVLHNLCERPVKHPSIWKESLTWIGSSDTHCTRGEFGRVTYWLQTLRSWRRWTHRKCTLKDSMQRKSFSQRKWKFYFFQSQMDESNFLEEIRN